MYTRLRFVGTALIVSQLVPAFMAHAAAFPDVSATHIYRQQIETLADRAIVKGNPDGTFRPEKTVNRAEMLTLLYRATEKNPAAPAKACFKDVGVDAWFSAVVCDAAAKGYVSGYSDGYFRPEKEVNKVEALKMIHTVFGFTLNTNASLDPLKAFTDVSLSSWYASYMANAYVRGVLPIPGQHATHFKPDAVLLRGEAAAYIFNALGLKLEVYFSSSSFSSTSSSASVTTRSSRSAESSARSSGIQTTNVDFPFGDDGSLKDVKGKSYVFSLTGKQTIAVDVKSVGTGSIECRLYKLDKETSFALEYYLGHKMGNNCSMRVTLGGGNYQLDVTPKGTLSSFTLNTKTATGDGNDGFVEAILLTNNKVKTGYLEPEDSAEWYYFNLTKQEKLTVEVVGTGNERCLIYPMANVDLFGFSGPMCNEEYDFPPGTYYVGVMRHDGRDGKESFTIRYR